MSQFSFDLFHGMGKVSAFCNRLNRGSEYYKDDVFELDSIFHSLLRDD